MNLNKCFCFKDFLFFVHRSSSFTLIKFTLYKSVYAFILKGETGISQFLVQSITNKSLFHHSFIFSIIYFFTKVRIKTEYNKGGLVTMEDI